MHCYCGNITPFEQCCLPIISGKAQAKTPEQLMRSRYSAYATHYPQYIYDTYSRESQQNVALEEIKQWSTHTHWLKLTIIKSAQVELETFNHQGAELPKVQFKALYIDDKKFYLMEENSRFIVENNHWYYLDGEIISHQQLTTPKRNQPCLCQSGKKFKQCCAAKL